MSRLLRGIAIAAGAGLGVCVATVIRPRGLASRGASPRCAEDDLLKLEPVLDRLERIEAFVDAAESVGPASPELDRRLLNQETQLRALHASVADIDKRAGATLDYVRNSFEELRQEIPTLIESTVAARVSELEARLQADITTSWDRSLAAFENAVEQKVAARIGVLEKALLDQSSAISDLRARSEQTDVNLQRLIVSIDRLCEVAPAVPLQTQAQETPRYAREPERENRKPRAHMARVFGALLAFGVSRLLR